jgi:hypothetical protein
MNIFSKLFSKKEPVSNDSSEHAVIVHLRYGMTDLAPLHELEDRLVSAINNAGVGEFDGHEVAVDGSDALLYMYGPNGDQLFAIVSPILKSSDYTKDAEVKIRYGSPQSKAKGIVFTVSNM